MKKIIAVIGIAALIGCLVFLLRPKEKDKGKARLEIINEKKVSLNCENLQKSRKYKLNLDETQREIHIKTSLEQGKFEVVLTNEDGKQYYKGTLETERDFVVTIEEGNQCIAKVNPKKATGIIEIDVQ